MTVFENTNNTILVFFKNCYSSLNLVFYMFLRKKKLVIKQVFPVSLVVLVFKNKKYFSKTGTKQPLTFFITKIQMATLH